jgi:hypothetical protein
VRSAVELLVIVALAAVSLWPARASVREIVAGLPLRYLAFSVTVVVLLLAGHAISRQAETYPLTEWDMYTTSDPSDPRFVDYMAVLPDGREQRILVAELFPAGGRHLRARIDQMVFAVEQSRGVQPFAQLDTMLFALRQAWREQHPADSLDAIRVVIGTVPAKQYRGPASITRTLLHEYRPS